jgi:AraC family transcriptional regulator
MGHTAPTVRGPEEFASAARDAGQRATMITCWQEIHLQQYDLAAGGWEHDPIGFYRIAIQETGSLRLERTLDGRFERCIRSSGQISISPPGCSQKWAWNGSMKIAMLFMPVFLFDELASEVGLENCPTLKTPLVTDDPAIRHIVSTLVDESRIPGNKVANMLIGTAGRYLVAHLLTRYPAFVVAGSPSDRSCDRRIRRAKEFIESHLSEDIGLADVADAVDMSSHYFCRVFRQSAGISPYRYLVSRRIERAKEFLTATDRSIMDIALDLGFPSHAQFSNVFRQSVGQTPRVYRRLAQSRNRD